MCRLRWVPDLIWKNQKCQSGGPDGQKIARITNVNLDQRIFVSPNFSCPYLYFSWGQTHRETFSTRGRIFRGGPILFPNTVGHYFSVRHPSEPWSGSARCRTRRRTWGRSLLHKYQGAMASPELNVVSAPRVTVVRETIHVVFFALELSKYFGLLSRVIFGSNIGTTFWCFQTI